MCFYYFVLVLFVGFFVVFFVVFSSSFLVCSVINKINHTVTTVNNGIL